MIARRVLGIALGWTVLAAVAAVVLGAVVDRASDGSARLTLFTIALAASDHAVREAARNSLMLATAVSLLATLLGVGLARLATVRAFRGLGALATLARASGAAPPLFGAIGIVGLGWGEGFGRWVALGWIELAWAVPRVMEATASALARVPASWDDAARLAGASRRRAWWLAARPSAARAAAGVFAVTLVEPTGPLVLGLRHTLGSEIVQAVLRGDRSERAAALGAVALALVLLGRAAVLWRGESPLILPPPEGSKARWGPRASCLGAISASLALLAWAVAGLLPLVGLVATALGGGQSGRPSPGVFLAALGDRELMTILADSAILGLGATATAALIATTSGAGRTARVGPSWRSPASWPLVLPGLILGLGAALLPGLLDGASGAMARRAPVLAGGMHDLADALDPFLSPWLLLVACVAILRVPELAEAAASAGACADRTRIDVARTLGATRWAAWRSVRAPRLMAIWGGALARSFARSALDAGPALLLCPTLSARPLGPGLLAVLAEPGGQGHRRAAAVAVIALIVPVGAWVMNRGRPGCPRLLKGPGN